MAFQYCLKLILSSSQLHQCLPTSASSASGSTRADPGSLGGSVCTANQLQPLRSRTVPHCVCNTAGHEQSSPALVKWKAGTEGVKGSWILGQGSRESECKSSSCHAILLPEVCWLCQLSLEFWAAQNAVNHVSKRSYEADKHGFYQYDFSL